MSRFWPIFDFSSFVTPLGSCSKLVEIGKSLFLGSQKRPKIRVFCIIFCLKIEGFRHNITFFVFYGKYKLVPARCRKFHKNRTKTTLFRLEKREKLKIDPTRQCTGSILPFSVYFQFFAFFEPKKCSFGAIFMKNFTSCWN